MANELSGLDLESMPSYKGVVVKDHHVADPPSDGQLSRSAGKWEMPDREDGGAAG